MRRWANGMLLAIGAIATTAGAQEGFPLDGTWRGERTGAGQSGNQSTTIVLVMQWDGQNVTGVINPGPKAIPLAAAKLIPEGWRVTLSARTAAGESISFDGTIGELGAYNRSITGTWTEGGREYRVRMVRE
jgi:hypothetical protein